MVAITTLWLPILLSAVFVFIASSIIHMATSLHKNDHKKVPDEDKAMDAIRPLNIPPGDYMMPRCANSKEMKSPEFTEKLKKGPVMLLTVYPNGPFAMWQSLVQWFLYSIVIGIFSAYVAGRALTVGTEYLQVFRFAGVTAFLGYAVALWQLSIWYKRSWGTTFRLTIDGLVYALLTAGVFGWLWPR